MVIRWRWVAGIAAAGILFSPRARGEPEWLRFDGNGWGTLSPDARQAYLAGFLAGSATAEAHATGVTDSAGIRQALDSLSRAGLDFPYSPNVYGARVEDFYWYVDQRPLPVWYVLWEVNNRLHSSPGGRQ